MKSQAPAPSASVRGPAAAPAGEVHRDRPELLVVCLTGDKGGVDRVIEQWLLHTEPERFRTTVIVRDVPGILRDICPSEHLRVVRLGFAGRRPTVATEAAAVWQIAKEMVRRGRVVVNVHDYYALQACLPAWTLVGNRAPLVATIHMHTSWIPGEFRAKRVMAMSEAHMLRRASAIIAVSHDYAARLEGLGFAKSAIRVIHNGIDTSSFGRTTTGRLEARRALGIPEGVLVFGFAGRFALQKRPVELVKAVAMLNPAERAGICLLMAGQGGLVDDVQQVIREAALEQTVRLVGHVDPIQGFYAALDVLVLSSSIEGLPMTLLEAMAGGVPALVTQVGGNAEIVVDGECGWVMGDYSPSCVVAGLRRVIASRQEVSRMGDAARIRIETKFSVEKMVRETNDLLENVWNGRRAK